MRHTGNHAKQRIVHNTLVYHTTITLLIMFLSNKERHSILLRKIAVSVHLAATTDVLQAADKQLKLYVHKSPTSMQMSELSELASTPRHDTVPQ